MYRFITLAALLVIPIVGSSTVLTNQDGGGEGPPLTSPLLEEATSLMSDVKPSMEVSDANRAHIHESFGRLPLYFIENQGQVEDEVAYYVKGSDKTLFFTPSGITFALASRKAQSAHRDLFGIERREGNQEPCQSEDAIGRWIVKMEFVGANPDVRPRGEDRQEAVFSYFKGKPEDWKAGIPTYSKVVYKELWPGIDLVYSGTVNKLKYDFIVKPGADPQKIRFALSGASDVVLEESGILTVKTPLGGFEDERPSAFQTISGNRLDVHVVYTLDRSESEYSFSLGFDVGAFDSRETLVIDPVVLVYCGYIGGKYDEWWGDIVNDKYGNVYITGSTHSDENSFPVKIGPYTNYSGDGDIYVAKINASGTFIEYCGYIGGSKYDSGFGIDIDDFNNIYVTGYTESSENEGFPVFVGPDLTFNGGNTDCFVAKINEDGSKLEYCGYIGGKEDEDGEGADIAVDKNGCAYVTGDTSSQQNTFPVTVGPDLIYNGHSDTFVAKINNTGDKLEYCGYIGGYGGEESFSICVDNLGCAYICGFTSSTETTFPIKSGPDITYNGGILDGYIAKVSESGSKLLFCGYIGGINHDVCTCLAIDNDNNIYVTGSTNSDENSFPVIKGPDLTYNDISDAFVAKIDSSEIYIIYCGYIGGNSGDIGCAIDVDEYGNSYVAGFTQSDENSFPVKLGPDITYNMYGDVFICSVNEMGSELNYCGYIGGDDSDYCKSITVDKLGNAIVMGNTQSDESTFPVKVGPDLTFNGKEFYDTDAFIAKVLTKGVFSDTYDLPAGSGGTLNFNLSAGSENEDRKYFLLGNFSGTSPGTQLPGGLVLPLNWDWFSDLVLLLANTPVFEDFCGQLNASGEATAQLNAGPLDPAYVGVILHFAYVLYAPFDFVSNPVPITIVP
jgi:hypothetical protein